MKLELFLYKLERKISKISIQRLMSLVAGAMLLIYIFDLAVGSMSDGGVSLYSLLSFDLNAILHGQVWRLITFVFLYPGASNILFVLLSIYFYWWVGTALEARMGTPKFNLYYLFGIIGSILAGVIIGLLVGLVTGTPFMYMTNDYLNLSLFLAFATMFPNIQVLIFFIIPIKVKWLGYIDGALLLYSFITGNMFSRIAIGVAMVNYFIFFGPYLIRVCKRKYQEYKWKKNNRF